MCFSLHFACVVHSISRRYVRLHTNLGDLNLELHCDQEASQSCFSLQNVPFRSYVRLHTNLGDLNLELHCDICPRTCENFMALAEGGELRIGHSKNHCSSIWLATATRGLSVVWNGQGLCLPRRKLLCSRFHAPARRSSFHDCPRSWFQC